MPLPPVKITVFWRVGTCHIFEGEVVGLAFRAVRRLPKDRSRVSLRSGNLSSVGSLWEWEVDFAYQDLTAGSRSFITWDECDKGATILSFFYNAPEDLKACSQDSEMWAMHLQKYIYSAWDSHSEEFRPYIMTLPPDEGLQLTWADPNRSVALLAWGGLTIKLVELRDGPTLLFPIPGVGRSASYTAEAGWEDGDSRDLLKAYLAEDALQGELLWSQLTGELEDIAGDFEGLRSAYLKKHGPSPAPYGGGQGQ